jgi:hypothetical protein
MKYNNKREKCIIITRNVEAPIFYLFHCIRKSFIFFAEYKAYFERRIMVCATIKIKIDINTLLSLIIINFTYSFFYFLSLSASLSFFFFLWSFCMTS